MVTESLQYTFTSQEEIEKIMGKTQFMNYVDDDGDRDAEEGIVEGVIIEATDEASFFLEGRYDPEDLFTSTWVRRHCSYLAAFMLSDRMGSPEHYVERATRTIERFVSVAKNVYQIPRLPVRSDFSPTMSNIRIENGRRDSRVRVVSTDLVGGTYSEQFLSSAIYRRLGRAGY